MELEKFEFTDLLSDHETLDGFKPNWEQEGYEIVPGILDQIVSEIPKKTLADIISETLDQIVSKICKKPKPKSKKRSADNTEIDKKKGDKKRQKKNTIKPSGEPLPAEQTPAMQALGEKPQDFNLILDRPSEKERNFLHLFHLFCNYM